MASNQSFEIFEIRSHWSDPSNKIENSIAKAQYVKSKKEWKLYWMKSDMKWHNYKPFPVSNSLEEILKAIEQDINGCFWG